MRGLTGLHVNEHTVDIEPPRATLGQLRLTNRHEMIRVENDVLGVAAALERIDSGLKMFHDLKQNIYVLYHEGLNEKGELVEQTVGAYQELDQRIIKLIERLDAQGRGKNDLVAELDRLERERTLEGVRRRRESVGPIAERLQHAMRKDLGIQDRVYPGQRKARDRKRRKR